MTSIPRFGPFFASNAQFFDVVEPQLE
jgi:hypothetical protein